MKKIKFVFGVTILLFFLSGCSLFYSDSTEKDGFYIAINKIDKCCFVGGYDCVEYTENLEITIPDECEGLPVKKIGGYYGRGVPTPFYISLVDLYMNTPDGSKYDGIFHGDLNNFEFSDDYRVEDVVFTLNIGKNIEEIVNVSMDGYYPHINEDNSITFYRSVVNVNCSEENKYFYSKEGKLYNKETNELITDFVYASSEL